tara:strand:+ start:110 stop:1027 length:918 start_codon:yes stop_codon:yes gene_type:complete
MTNIAILDGGLGQEIHKRATIKAHPLWSVKVMLEQPEIVKNVHRDFVISGSRVICLNTYTATPSRMRRHGHIKQLETAHSLAQTLARQSLKELSLNDGSVQIAGCLPPLVASYVSEASMNYEKSLNEYRQLVNLQKDTVDLFLIETMSNTHEAKAALRAAQEVHIPAYVSFTIRDDLSNKLRSGEDLRRAIEELSYKNPNGILINCSSPESITKAIPVMTGLSIPFGALGNGFKSIAPLKPGSTVETLSERKDLSPRVYSEFALEWIGLGATIIGGCCEIGPKHISFLCNKLKEEGYTLAPLPVY